MRPLLYGELASWYRLVDPLEDHRSETAYEESFARVVKGQRETLLEQPRAQSRVRACRR